MGIRSCFPVRARQKIREGGAIEPEKMFKPICSGTKLWNRDCYPREWQSSMLIKGGSYQLPIYTATANPTIWVDLRDNEKRLLRWYPASGVLVLVAADNALRGVKIYDKSGLSRDMFKAKVYNDLAYATRYGISTTF